MLESAFPLQLPNEVGWQQPSAAAAVCPRGGARLRVRFRASRQSPGDFLELHRWPCAVEDGASCEGDAPTRHHAEDHRLHDSMD